MRKILPERLESGRVTQGRFASSVSDRGYGCFYVQGPCGEELKIISSEGDAPGSEGWEHVSISTRRRTPNWQEMCFVKNLFWSDDETVVQFHPPKADYINNHPHCLHLWRNSGAEFPRPPPILVGVRDMSNMTAEEARTVRAWTE